MVSDRFVSLGGRSWSVGARHRGCDTIRLRGSPIAHRAGVLRPQQLEYGSALWTTVPADSGCPAWPRRVSPGHQGANCTPLLCESWRAVLDRVRYKWLWVHDLNLPALDQIVKSPSVRESNAHSGALL
jgi:hypothetical protein